MSSYNSPLPVGSAQGTGAAAIAIAETAGGTNNVGNATDSAGNVRVDFVWGNYPMQPNDERAAAVTPANISANSSGDYAWGATTRVAADRLNASLSNHAVAEAEWNTYPQFTPGVGNYKVTAATGNGTTVTYTAQNNLAKNDVVNITGLTASAYNLSSATVATADKLKFTVTNAANAGEITGQWYGKVEATNALTAYDGAGITFINVPNVLGETTALALDELKDAGYEAASITTASAASNVGKTITAVARSAGLATFQVTSASHGFVAGNKVTISDVSGGDGINGVWTVGAVATNTFEVLGTATTVQALTGLAGVVSGVVGTIKTQSVAAGTASVASTATITITPWAAAS